MSQDKTILGFNRYGKGNVRFIRVNKDSPRHEIKEVKVQMLLSGKFDLGYLKADNSQIVPTETQKNTLYVLGKKYPIEPIEEWGQSVAKDMMSRHLHISSVGLEIDEVPWERIKVFGQEHNHAFQKGGGGTRFAIMNVGRDGKLNVISGFKDLTVMKTTQSGFSGYIKDEYTTLKETKERILCTKIRCQWTYRSAYLAKPGTIPFSNIFKSIEQITLETFAGEPQKGVYSASVQHTMYLISQAVLAKHPEIDTISFALPNIHFYLVDFNEFRTPEKNNGEIFLTFDGAHGQIEATFQRDTIDRGVPPSKL